MTVDVISGDARTVISGLADRFAAVVTDPPYELGMDTWDSTGVAFDARLWRAVHDVMLPGAWLAAFGAARLYHRLATAIEVAGLEVRDCGVWMYAGGMPNSRDVARDLDRLEGVAPLQIDRKWVGDPHGNRKAKRLHRVTAPASELAQQWRGWGTTLRPAWEPIVIARRPLERSTVAENVKEHGVGAINVNARVNGGWPSNVMATDDVLGRLSPVFVVPKAKGARRAGADHPTVKPVDLMVHLLRLFVPPGGRVLDPFAGSGTTGVAAQLLGIDATLIELDEGYAEQARGRIDMTEPLA